MTKDTDQGTTDPTTMKRSDKANNNTGSAPSVTTMRTAPSARQATGTQTATNTSTTRAVTATVTAETSKSKATPTSTPQKAHGVGTPKAISKPNTPKAGTTKPSSAVKTNNATLEVAQSTVERNLRQQLASSHALVEALTKENEEMAQALEQERNRLNDLADQVRSEATYSHQVSRLVRVFRELDINLPPLDLEDWNARQVADQVRDVIGDGARAMDESIQFNSALECLRLILGAAEVVPSSNRPNTFKFILRNDLLKREMSFWLSWTETTFTYTKINIDIPEKDAPEFLSEQSIDFDVRQGPNFLLQVLGCVFHQS